MLWRIPIFAFLFLMPVALQASIVTDQFGYPIDGKKVAIIKVPQTGQDSGQHSTPPGSAFYVRNLETDEIVFEGTVVSWSNGAEHQQSGDLVWHLDFSELTEPGLYQIEEPQSGRISHPFEIRENPWKNVLKAAVRSYFYQRSGHEKRAEYAGENWADAAAYLQEKETRDYFDQNNPDRFRDLHGGWFDAGDFNKYITFTSSAVHPLLAAYRLNPHIWGDDYNIPESGNGLPDLLDELKWQMDWVLRMQVEDGGVIIKMGAKEYYSASPPSSDNRNRYYGRVSTSSTIAFASMTAHAALVYREFPEWEDYADTLMQAGLKAYEYFVDYYDRYGELNTNSDRGEIKSGDADRSVESQLSEAALFGIYMFALTGDEKWNDLVRERYRDIPLLSWWGPYNNYFGEGLLYYTTLNNADESIREEVLQRFRTKPGTFYGNAVTTDPYYAGMPDSQYHWGSLSVLSNTGILNLNVARYLDEPNEEDYIQRARDILHYIHGRNPLDKCYLSNMYVYGAENPVNEFYHGWFEHGSPWQNVLFSEKGGPAPGFLVGGPNRAYTGGENPYLELNQPPQKMYTDFSNGWPYNSWEITENSIGYQAAYIRLLSEFVSLSSDTIRYAAEVPDQSDNGLGSGETPDTFELHQNFPNPFNPATTIRFDVSRTSTVTITVHTITGQKVATILNEVRTPGQYSVNFDAAGLSTGIYMYRLTAGDFSQTRKMVFVK
ncbi:MAG: T9SS C-terminal target domain-containing protein [Balneolaceae bacterium]|nr:MAG: T9SS C-terminal target domain-containing protein [Balneolaceae bacterium]